VPERDPSPLEDGPEIRRIRRRRPWLWPNPNRQPIADCAADLPITRADLFDAAARWHRFAALLADCFPELTTPQNNTHSSDPDSTGNRDSHLFLDSKTGDCPCFWQRRMDGGGTDRNGPCPAAGRGGRIESALLPVPKFAEALRSSCAMEPPRRLLVKADHALPLAGSVKARGGIYAVLHFAEAVALRAGLLSGPEDDYRKLNGPAAKELLSGYELSVASTGNLGLSIGIAGAALGFRVAVHMSREAKEWKKQRLRDRGVRVVEHEGDYTSACAAARKAAADDDRAHFIDDENSRELFLGYSTAAIELAEQLEAAGIAVDAEHPLMAYLPCGVGGAPGGITFGLRHVFGDAAWCFFAEPVEAPCMLLGMLTGRHSEVSVCEAGLHLATDADGLAVAKPSRFVGRLMEPLLAGCYTVTDDRLYRLLADLYETESIEVEPSAAAGCAGPEMLLNTDGGRALRSRHGLAARLPAATHLIWTTGGSLVPAAQHAAFRRRAEGIG